MNEKSASALQKIGFILLLIVVGVASYHFVRERLRADRERSDVGASAVVARSPVQVGMPERVSTVEKPIYAPLRARAVTNLVRALPNRSTAALTGNDRRIAVADANSVASNVANTIGSTATPGATFGAFAGNGNGGQNNASVTGRAILRGTPPAEKIISLDATCGRLHTTPLTTRFYVVSSDGGLADTFVYVKAGAPRSSSSVAPAILDQVNCEYQPYVFGVQAGQSFNVRNSDGFAHNVRALPTTPGNRERNIVQPVRGTVTPFVFAKPEVFVQFKCDVHPWMFAYVGVVDHPWFAVTDKDGNFSLPPGLPPGQYTLAAVHRKAGQLLQQITVRESGTEPVTFTFELPDALVKANTPK